MTDFSKIHLFLASNTLGDDGQMFSYCEEEVKEFIDGRKVLYIPYAMKNLDWFAARSKERFKALTIQLDSIHEFDNPVEAVKDADAFFVGGGNTFRLLSHLYKNKLLSQLRERVLAGIPYLGASAGSGIGAPTIRTTNDMPIVEVPSLASLNLFPFQINAHFIDGALLKNHKGETREARIKEFHEENDATVVGLREGAWLHIKGSHLVLRGTTGAKIFVKGQDPKEYKAGDHLDFLLHAGG